MTVRIGKTSFDRVVYDEIADVLYLTVGDAPIEADSTMATPEGHAIRYDADGSVIGITFVNAKWLMDRDGELALYRIGADVIAPALALTN